MKYYDLTTAQQQIFDAEQYAAGVSMALCGAVSVSGTVKIRELENCINTLYRYNDALRTRIVISSDGIPRQYFEEYTQKSIPQLLFADENAYKEYAMRFAKEPMPVTSELCMIQIITVQNDVRLLIKIHHIISDAWTMGLLVRQMQKLLHGEEIAPHSYTGYIEKNDRYRNSVDRKDDEHYFQAIIEDFQKENSDLNTDPAFVALESYSSFRRIFVIPQNLVDRIREYCDENSCTPAMFWMTCYAVYFSQVAGNPELFFLGMPLNNRITKQELDTVGMFVNNVPVPVRMLYAESFKMNLENSIEESCYTAMRHQMFNSSEAARIGAGRLYDVIYSYQQSPVQKGNLPAVEQFYCGNQIEKLQIHIEEETSSVVYEFRNDQYTSMRIELLHESILGIISTVLKADSTPVKQLAILSEREENLLDSFNATEIPLPDEKNIYDLFEETVHIYPDRICLCYEDRTYSYREFEALIIQTDRRLREVVKGGQNAVAVFCERSVELYAAVYAILRSGNIYLPLSVDDPPHRTAIILKNAGAAAVLTQEKYNKKDFGVPAVILPECPEAAVTENGPVPERIKGKLAYILYTSGSTGQPKGAMIRHESLLNRILWMQRAYCLEPDDVILQKTPVTFDVSLWELLWWGICGAGLAISHPDEHFLPDKITADIRKYGVTHIHFVPAVFDKFLEYLENNPVRTKETGSLKQIFLSGEALHASTVLRARALFGDSVKLHNLYGPTECTVDVTSFDCSDVHTDPVPIGKPIDNTSVYILNSQLQRLPVGTTGELVIGGIGVSSGYVNDEGQTAEKFIADPYHGGTMYRTGDLAYIREDGNIIYCGRKDSQVKLNGQRIEPGVIENTVCSVEGVQSAAVLVDSRNGDNFLRAFYTGTEDNADRIEAFCRKTLPPYMVPHVWNHIYAIPVTPNGKRNSRALLELPVIQHKSDGQRSPVNHTEQKICGIFSTVLKNKEIDRNTDFFAVGGTSMNVISALSAPLLHGIPVHEFMQNPTPAGLAEKLQALETDGFRILQRLNEVGAFQKALLLFPPAGGSALSFTALNEELKKTYPDVAVFGTGYLYTDVEIAGLAEEIKKLSEFCKIKIYSHCAGAAIAAAVLRKLQETGSECVEEYISGALIPPAQGRKSSNIWRTIPRHILLNTLKRSGLPLSNLNNTEIREFTERFLRDTDFYFKEFSGKPADKIICRTRVIISNCDPFTRNTASAEKFWRQYFSNVTEIRITDSESHYFHSTEAEKISAFIFTEK